MLLNMFSKCAANLSIVSFLNSLVQYSKLNCILSSPSTALKVRSNLAIFFPNPYGFSLILLTLMYLHLHSAIQTLYQIADFCLNLSLHSLSLPALQTDNLDFHMLLMSFLLLLSKIPKSLFSLRIVSHCQGVYKHSYYILQIRMWSTCYRRTYYYIFLSTIFRQQYLYAANSIMYIVVPVFFVNVFNSL